MRTMVVIQVRYNAFPQTKNKHEQALLKITLRMGFLFDTVIRSMM